MALAAEDTQRPQPPVHRRQRRAEHRVLVILRLRAAVEETAFIAAQAVHLIAELTRLDHAPSTTLADAQRHLRERGVVEAVAGHPAQALGNRIEREERS